MAPQVATVLLLMVAAFSPAGQGRADVEISVVDRSTVRIVVSGPNGLGGGSGFIVSRGGAIVTNSHVISGAQKIFVLRDNNGSTLALEATLIRDGERRDLALLSAPGIGGAPAKIAIDQPGKGADIFALGFTGIADFGNVDIKSPGFVDSSVSRGAVRRVTERPISPGIFVEAVQHSAPIGPGDSGGALYDTCGRVVGVNTQFLSSNTGGAEVSEAVASSELIDFARSAGVRLTTVGGGCSDVRGGAVATGSTDAETTNRSASYRVASLIVLLLAVIVAGAVLSFVFLGRRPQSGSAPGSPPRSRAAPRYGAQHGHAQAPSLLGGGAASSPAFTLTMRARSGATKMTHVGADSAARGVTIGRSSDCDIKIADPSISRKHATLRRQGGVYLIVDDGSTNGVKINGRRIAPLQQLALSNGDRLLLGEIVIVFEVGG